MTGIQFWEIGWQELECVETFTNFFFGCSLHFMPENDVKQSDWFKDFTSFSAMKDENHTVFPGKVPSHSISCHPISQNWIPFIQIESMSIYFISTGRTQKWINPVGKASREWIKMVHWINFLPRNLYFFLLIFTVLNSLQNRSSRIKSLSVAICHY